MESSIEITIAGSADPTNEVTEQMAALTVEQTEVPHNPNVSERIRSETSKSSDYPVFYLGKDQLMEKYSPYTMAYKIDTFEQITDGQAHSLFRLEFEDGYLPRRADVMATDAFTFFHEDMVRFTYDERMPEPLHSCAQLTKWLKNKLTMGLNVTPAFRKEPLQQYLFQEVPSIRLAGERMSMMPMATRRAGGV